jgi:hypothetical protein
MKKYGKKLANQKKNSTFAREMNKCPSPSHQRERRGLTYKT